MRTRQAKHCIPCSGSDKLFLLLVVFLLGALDLDAVGLHILLDSYLVPDFHQRNLGFVVVNFPLLVVFLHRNDVVGYR